MPPTKVPHQVVVDGILHEAAYSWTESKTPVPYQSAQDDGEALPRKVKHRTLSRRSYFARWENWLSGLAPSALRFWFWNTPMFPTFALVYCLLSAIVLSGYVYAGLWKSLGWNAAVPGLCVLPPVVYDTDACACIDSSPLEHVALDHLLAKVSSLYPQPIELDPNALMTPPASLSFSACLWIHEADVEYIEGWAAEWRGPLSLLIATNATPSSSEHTELTAKLAALQRKHPPLKQNLFLVFWLLVLAWFSSLAT
ncbi:hypothetical protein NUW54_g9308 [Trametes sanguinea]|uniref:Uncharacterized protein n=1 Tax=Trametes sanguinea TaxID=158606 RepID=A0ACC1P7X9_9APHY|nr:hypothetical protein NUW54_g9308 [Trametes sanguinea]